MVLGCQLDPATESPYFSANPETMLAEIKEEMDAVRKRAGIGERMAQLDEPTMSHFLDRMRLSGEAAAIDWLERKVPASDEIVAE